MLIPYKCGGCGKDDQYDTDKAVLLHARKESEQFGRPVHYHVFRCNHCGARNERRPPEGSTPPAQTRPPSS
jgi:hypothetical protein